MNTSIPPIDPAPADASSVAADAAVLAKDAATVAEQTVSPAAASSADKPIAEGSKSTVVAAKLAADDRRQAAAVIAEATVAREDKQAERTVMAEAKLADERAADRKERYDFYRPIIVQVLLTIPVAIAAIGSAIAAWRTGTVIESQAIAKKEVGEYRHEVNSMKDELVEAVRKASRAEGVLEGKKGKDE